MLVVAKFTKLADHYQNYNLNEVKSRIIWKHFDSIEASEDLTPQWLVHWLELHFFVGLTLGMLDSQGLWKILLSSY